jgi:AbrB family looped-hinge helix DNA binding protein
MPTRCSSGILIVGTLPETFEHVDLGCVSDISLYFNNLRGSEGTYFNNYPHHVVGMSQVVDRRRRVVIPKHVAKSLDIQGGDRVIFEKIGDHYAIAKAGDRTGRLAEVMDRIPERTGKPQPVSPREMKRIWKE